MDDKRQWRPQPSESDRVDILVWPDGYWCYRVEFDSAVGRAFDYKVIRMGTPEWLALIKHRRDR